MGFGVPIDAAHHKINVRLVFDVKASGKRKGRLVARGDLTPEPDEAVYSSVASLRSLRTIIFPNRSLLSSGGLMADEPCLDHSLDGY